MYVLWTEMSYSKYHIQNIGITDIIFQICPHCKDSGYKRRSHTVKWAGYLLTDAQGVPPPSRDAEQKRRAQYLPNIDAHLRLYLKMHSGEK